MAGAFRLVPVPRFDPWLRFPSPLVEPDVRISRIRLSDRASRGHPRVAVPSRLELDEPEGPVQVLDGEACRPLSPNLVLAAQPPAEPLPAMAVHVPVGLLSCPPGTPTTRAAGLHHPGRDCSATSEDAEDSCDLASYHYLTAFQAAHGGTLRDEVLAARAATCRPAKSGHVYLDVDVCCPVAGALDDSP